MKNILYNYIKFGSFANIIYQQLINDLTISKYTGLIFRAISIEISFFCWFLPKNEIQIRSIIILKYLPLILNTFLDNKILLLKNIFYLI